jgi:cerevisin
MSSFLSLSLLALSVASGSYATPLSTSPLAGGENGGRFGVAPLVAGYHPHGSVNSSYIVTFKDGVHPELVSNHMNFLTLAMESDSLQGGDAELTHVYNSAVQGYAGKFSEDLVQQIRAMPEVELVEKDQIMMISETTKQIGAPWVSAPVYAEILVAVQSR